MNAGILPGLGQRCAKNKTKPKNEYLFVFLRLWVALAWSSWIPSSATVNGWQGTGVEDSGLPLTTNPKIFAKGILLKDGILGTNCILEAVILGGQGKSRGTSRAVLRYLIGGHRKEGRTGMRGKDRWKGPQLMWRPQLQQPVLREVETGEHRVCTP